MKEGTKKIFLYSYVGQPGLFCLSATVTMGTQTNPSTHKQQYKDVLITEAHYVHPKPSVGHTESLQHKIQLTHQTKFHASLSTIKDMMS